MCPTPTSPSGPQAREQVQTAILAYGTFRPTPEDLAACYRAQLRWRYRRPQILYCPLLASVTASLVVLAGGDRVTAWTLLQPFCLMFAIFAALLALAYLSAPWTARRNYRRQPNLRQEWRVEFSPSGLRAVTDSQDNFVAWSDYIAWSRDARVWLVWQANHLVQFIPVRALSPESAKVVTGLVSHLPRR